MNYDYDKLVPAYGFGGLLLKIKIIFLENQKCKI